VTLAPTSAATAPPDVAARRAAAATYLAFIAAGFAFATWASAIPRYRDHLGLTPAELGLVLLAAACGSLLAMPTSGPLIHRFGSRFVVTVTALVLTGGLLAVAFGYLVGVAPVVIGLAVFGIAYGLWDVAMNVQGAIVEQRLGRSIMPRFHAGFSLGTVAGALLGALLVWLGVPVTVHLSAVAVLLGVVVPLGARPFLPDRDDVAPAPEPGAPPVARGSALAAWLEPRTLLIGLFVLAFAFAEGTANDWISVAAIDGYHLSPALGTLTFAVFLTAMTTGRWFGPGLLDRHGRVPVIRGMAAVGIAGSALFVFAPSPWLAGAGALFWGLGVSLGFPVGMSAAADDPKRAAGRVSVVASIGYCAFLAGPPSIGFLGEHYTVLRALTTVAMLLAVAALISPVLRPPDDVTRAG
jgi:MFS family permease